MAKKKTPRHDAAAAWLAQAKKGESFEFWRGEFSRTCKTPEQNMTNAERRAHTTACRAAKKNGTLKPRIPDPYKELRPDARAVEILVDYWELRGLIESKIEIIDEHTRAYTMICMIQRNGLAAVRARK